MAIRIWRAALVIGGVLLLALGGAELFGHVGPISLAGLGRWFVAAIVLHDAVLAPLVLLASLGARRIGRRVGWRSVVIVQTGVVVGLIVTLVTVPEIVKKQMGVRNPSVLPLDYGVNLAIVWACVVVGVVVALLVARMRARRREADVDHPGHRDAARARSSSAL